MLKRITLLLIVLTSFTITYADARVDSCRMNGYSNRVISSKEAAIANALAQQNPKALSQQINYPMSIRLSSGQRTINSPQEFLKYHDQIFVEQDAKRLVQELQKHPKDYVCRSDGIGLMNGGIWLSPNNYKISSLNDAAIPNTKIKADIPYGRPIPAITNKQTLQRFAQLYNKLHHDKVIDGPALYIDRIAPQMWTLNSAFNQGSINLFKADINNDGTPEYVLTYNNQGSMGTDGINFIGAIKNNHLVPLKFFEILKKNFKVDREDWYLFHSTPFLTSSGLVYMNYQSNGTRCTYLWKGRKIKLITQDSAHCIHSN